MNRREFTSTAVSTLAASAIPVRFRQQALRVDGARLNGHLAALGEFGKNPAGGVSRVAFTEFDRQAREAVMGWMRAARLDVSIDLAANLVGRRPGSDSSLQPIVLGSHIDSVPMGGNYDGQVGSTGAIEVADTLAAAGISLRHPLEVLIFSNEEGGTIGSHAITDGLPAAELERVSQSGKTFREGIRFLGGDPERLDAVRRSKGDIAGYLELHIEQGGRLDQAGIPIGVVLGIVGIRHWTSRSTDSGITPAPRP